MSQYTGRPKARPWAPGRRHRRPNGRRRAGRASEARGRRAASGRVDDATSDERRGFVGAILRAGDRHRHRHRAGAVALIKTFLAQAFYIPSESMEQTLCATTGCSSACSSRARSTSSAATSSCSATRAGGSTPGRGARAQPGGRGAVRRRPHLRRRAAPGRRRAPDQARDRAAGRPGRVLRRRRPAVTVNGAPRRRDLPARGHRAEHAELRRHGARGPDLGDGRQPRLQPGLAATDQDLPGERHDRRPTCSSWAARCCCSGRSTGSSRGRCPTTPRCSTGPGAPAGLSPRTRRAAR